MLSPGNAVRALRSARQLPARTPLRVKLVTAVLALVAIALAVISITGISVLKRYLLSQYDSALQSVQVKDSAFAAVGFYLRDEFYPRSGSPEYAVDWVTADRVHPVIQLPNPASGSGLSQQYLPGPRLRADARWLAAHADGRPATVAAQSGGGRWRVLVLSASSTSTPSYVVVGFDVRSVYATIGKLALIDLIVSLIVIGGVAVVGIALVRTSLRPLTDIERTAGAIAAGDLTRRVPDRDPRTEVGRLGRSLNAMLAQIETAFAARAASETAARRSEERMRQFVADASHELRTPLTAIRGFAEYYRQRGGADLPPGEPAAIAAGPAARTGMTAGARGAAAAGRGGGSGGGSAGPLAAADLNRIMRRVEQEAARMGVLVEDMLLLARLDQQRPLERRTVDLLALAADAVHDARVVAPDRAINLTVGSGAALLVLGDETRLRQVIGNLMGNALGHTPDGTPIDVRIRSGRLDEGRAGPAGPAGPAAQWSAAVLEVADHGPGLTAEQAERVFERFYRVDKARTSTSGGTGLGLAIVAGLVAAHGGAVWVESPPGGGAVFRIALPLAPEALGGDLTGEADPDAEPGTAPDSE